MQPLRWVAVSIAIGFHVLLVVFFWRVLVVPLQKPVDAIAWVTVSSLKPAPRALRFRPDLPIPPRSREMRALPNRQPIRVSPAQPMVAASDESPPLLSSAALIQGVRLPDQGSLRRQAEEQVQKLFGNMRNQAPGVATPAIDGSFRNPTRAPMRAIPDVGDGIRRMILTDKYGHEFVCSQRHGAPIDPIGMSTQVTCSSSGDGPSNTADWFKRRGID